MSYIRYILCAFLLATIATPSHAERQFISLASGPVTGVYYPISGTLCRLLNRGAKRHSLRCTVESSKGSPFNLMALRDNEADIIIVRADYMFSAYTGQAFFSDFGAFNKMRTLFSLYTTKQQSTALRQASKGDEPFSSDYDAVHLADDERVLVMARSDVDDVVIYEFVKAVMDVFENFTATHPIMHGLTKDDAVTHGVIAPFHNGALRYYHEAGLVD